jgi:predicted transcriptional regulator
MKLQTLPLYKKLVELRRHQNLSQRKLAKKLGLAQSYLSKIEAGKTDMGLANFVEIVRYLGAEVMIIPAPLVPVVSTLIAPQSSAAGAEKRPRWAENFDDELEEDL